MTTRTTRDDAARARPRRGPLRAGAGASRRLADGVRGRGGRRPRGERRRQDDDPARHLRHCRSKRRHRALGQGAQGWPRGSGEGRSRPRSGRARHVRGAVGHREPPARRVRATGPERESGHCARVRVLPVDGRTGRAARRNALRWRAADARPRPGADEPAAAAPSRRALARARADDRARVLPDRPRAERERGPHRARRRAGRAYRAPELVEGVCARGRTRGADGDERTAPGGRVGAPLVPWVLGAAWSSPPSPTSCSRSCRASRRVGSTPRSPWRSSSSTVRPESSTSRRARWRRSAPTSRGR